MAKKSNKLNKSNKKYKGVDGFGPQAKPPFVSGYSPQGFPNLGVTGIPEVGGNTYFTQNAPYGTITSGDASYAPGSFDLNTPFTEYSSQYDADPFVPGVQQGPVMQQRAQELGYKPEEKKKKNSPFDYIKRNDAVTLGLFGVDAILRKNQAIRDNYNYQNRLRNVFTQKPITPLQPQVSGIIYAENGAEIRKTASPNFGDVEVEGGEFIQLPDFSTQHVQGPSHAKGGVHTSLPEGSRVFSDFLTPVGSKQTYARHAKKHDTREEEKILNNPFSNPADRRTAEIMFKRKQSILNELFADQQIQNGNSDGTDQAAEERGMPQEMSQEMMGKFGLDLKEGEKLSFTNPFEYGGEYVGGTAQFEDGGMFPEDSTFYGATPGDPSNLTIGTKKIGKSAFQGGGTKGGSDSNDPWIRKILEFEATKGSAAGKGLANFGYNDWKKLGHSKPPASIEEAIQYFKKDYLPKVEEYPAGLRERVADYIFNTGRDPKDLLLYNAGVITLGQLNSPKTFDKEWKEYGPQIEKMFSNPDFINKLDDKKLDVYRTTKQVDGKPNPAFEATWKDRATMWGEYAPQQTGSTNPTAPTTTGIVNTPAGLGVNAEQGKAQVENQAENKLKQIENAAINQGAPATTDSEATDGWNWGQNYGLNLSTGFPQTTPPINPDAIFATQDAGSPLTAPPAETQAKVPYDEWVTGQPKNISRPKLQKMYKEYSDAYDAAVAAGKAPVVLPRPAVDPQEVRMAAELGRGVQVPSTALAREQAETGQFVAQANQAAAEKSADDENYGTKRIEKIKSTFSRDPKYKFRAEDLPQIKEELKTALKEWGLDSKENIADVDKVSSLNGFTSLAEKLQNKIYESDPEMTVDYGINEAPTLQGLQHLSKLTDEELNTITGGNTALKTKIKSARYGSRYNFSDDEIKSLSAGIKKLPEDKQKEYGKTNFMDKSWFYRRPIVKEVPFKNKEEYEEYKKRISVGGKYVPESTGLYVKPIYEPETPVEKGKEENPPTTPAGSEFTSTEQQKQMPSTAGEFPLYQAIPEALGYLSGLNPYTYFTPDYTHTEIVPPTLNIDDEIQSINDTTQSAIRQSTGNPSIDNSRNAALFNTALQAKQQAFARKQNYDAQARFQADQYNAQARDLENFRDVSSAAQIYNDYRAVAMDAAERERISAITNVVKKKAQHDADEFTKMFYFTTMYPNYYYEGRDKKQPIKFNPYGNTSLYSSTKGAMGNTGTTSTTSTGTVGSGSLLQKANPLGYTPLAFYPAQVNKTSKGFSANMDPRSAFAGYAPEFNQVTIPDFNTPYGMNMGQGTPVNPNQPVTVLNTPNTPNTLNNYPNYTPTTSYPEQEDYINLGI
jgi:hypothetical protein